MPDIKNSSKGFSQYVEAQTSNKYTEELDLQKTEELLNSSGILKKIISKPVTDALKNEFNDNLKIKIALREVVENIRTFGKALIVYDEGKDLTTRPSKDFKQFLIYNEWSTIEGDEGNIEISVKINGVETQIQPHKDRYIVFNLGSEVKAVWKYIEMLEKAIEVPTDMLGRDQLNYLKIAGLAEALAGCGGDCRATYAKLWDKIQTLFNLMENTSIVPIDENEEFGQIKKPVSDYKNLQEFLMTMVSAVSEIPTTILFGLSPSGFNGGSHELENYYNYVHSDVQIKILEPLIVWLSKIMNLKHEGFSPIKTRSIDDIEKETDIISKRANILSSLHDMLEDTPSDKQVLDYIFKGVEFENLQS